MPSGVFPVTTKRRLQRCQETLKDNLVRLLLQKKGTTMTSGSQSTIFLNRLEQILKGPLPGLTAHRRMAPSDRDVGFAPKDHCPKRAGVLILLYPNQTNDQLYLVLTRRTETLLNHKGQISLPGGSQEPDDSSLAHTAVREACEEVGVCADDIRVLGRLTPVYIPPSDFCVHPYVAYTPRAPSFLAQPDEVAELLQLPIVHLFDESNVRSESWVLRDKETEVPYFDVFGHKVWGATAIILSELIEVLRSAGFSQKKPI